MKLNFWVMVVLVVSWLNSVIGLVGYDCAAANANITTISLNQIGDCNLLEAQVKNSTTYIQLLQILSMGSIPVQTCRVRIFREVHHCGMHSHSSEVAGGLAEYIQETSREQCQRMQDSGRLYLGQNTIDGIKRNSTSTFSITLAGKLSSGGSCQGTYYSDPYGNWDEVIVQASVRITLTNYEASTHLTENRVSLLSGTRCTINAGTCTDNDGGYAFWNIIPQETCQFSNYGLLYQGHAEKLIDESQQHAEIVYSVVTQDVTFALTTGEHRTLCGYTLLRTEHPKLFILEGRPDAFVKKPGSPSKAQDLDLFTYINSKFVYVERHVRTQINGLYKDVLIQRCKLEQEVLRTSQTLALIKPDEFAYNYNKGPGYTAIVTGEVIRMIKCVPIEVKLDKVERCYQELPVRMGNTSYFLTPRTHILKTRGFEVQCNTLLPAMYEIDDVWYKMLPFPSEGIEPHMLTPTKQPTWIYQSPGNLARQGVYSEEDLDKLRDYIMTPFEQPAIINNIIRVATGEQTNTGGLNFGNFLDEDALQSIAKSTLTRLWTGFNSFGTFSAGILGIVLCLKVIKYCIDTLIHMFALHAVFGWSFRLVGALMDSVTNALLHLQGRNPTPPTTPVTAAENLNVTTAPTGLATSEPIPLTHRVAPAASQRSSPSSSTSSTAPVETRPYGLA